MNDGLRHALTFSPLVHHLRTRIQYNLMSFFGVCGGAMLVGKDTHYRCLRLDLLYFFSVVYDANISVAAAVVKTSFEERVMQMTTGCALAVVMTYDQTTSM